MDHYKSYVFGGLIQESDGRFRPTNDLIEVSTKSVVLDKTQTDAENPIKPSFAYTQADEAHVKLIRDHGGIKPLPRREHQALLITNNRYMLIYGGKCDNAFSYKTDERGGSQNEIYNDVTSTSLDDIMLFQFETNQWIAVAHRGWRPEPRWASAICYHEQMEQLFVFGGTGANGSCRNDVYVCDLHPNRSKAKNNELLSQIREIDMISKRVKNSLTDQ